MKNDNLPLDNFRNNALKIIDENESFWYNVFLLKTPYSFPDSVNICDIIYIFKTKDIKSKTNKKYQNLTQSLRDSNSLDKSNNYYIVAIKIVQGPFFKVSNYLIIEDMLNLLTFKTQWFICETFFFDKEPCLTELTDLDLTLVKNNPDSKELTRNFKIIFNLREEQYRLVQKILTKFHQSLKIVELSRNLGIILLISMIEVMAQKYGENREEFNDSIPFYEKLSSEMDKSLKNLIIQEKRTKFFEEIGNIYMKSAFSGAKAKFKMFFSKFLPYEFFNEKVEELASDLYDFRSKSLHEGDFLPIQDKNKICSYNIHLPKSDKLKMAKAGDFKYERIVRIPPYNHLFHLSMRILQSFLAHLDYLKDKEEDKAKYTQADKSDRTTFKSSIKGRGMVQSGKQIKFEEFYQTVDYLSLFRIKDYINKTISKLFTSRKFKKCIEECEIILKEPTFSMNFHAYRSCVYFQALAFFENKQINEFLNIFLKYKLDMNGETLILFKRKLDWLKFQKLTKEVNELEEKINLKLLELKIEKETLVQFKENQNFEKENSQKKNKHQNFIRYYQKLKEFVPKTDCVFPQWFHNFGHGINCLKQNNNMEFKEIINKFNIEDWTYVIESVSERIRKF